MAIRLLSAFDIEEHFPSKMLVITARNIMEVYIHTTKDTPRYHSIEPKKSKTIFSGEDFSLLSKYI